MHFKEDVLFFRLSACVIVDMVPLFENPLLKITIFVKNRSGGAISKARQFQLCCLKLSPDVYYK